MNKRRNEQLRQEREKRGWSQARVAEQIETDAANISRWERGYATPSPYFREKLCLLFGKTAQDLGFVQDEQQGDEQQPSTAFMSPSEPIHPQEQQNIKTHAPDILTRLIAVLSYLCGWVSGLFLFLLNRDRFVRFHSLQALLFFSASHLLSLIIFALLMWLTFLKKTVNHAPTHSLDLIGTTLLLLLVLINLFTFVVWIVGMIQAWQGHYYRLPFVGGLSEKIVIPS